MCLPGHRSSKKFWPGYGNTCSLNLYTTAFTSTNFFNRLNLDLRTTTIDTGQGSFSVFLVLASFKQSFGKQISEHQVSSPIAVIMELKTKDRMYTSSDLLKICHVKQCLLSYSVLNNETRKNRCKSSEFCYSVMKKLFHDRFSFNIPALGSLLVSITQKLIAWRDVFQSQWRLVN